MQALDDLLDQGSLTIADSVRIAADLARSVQTIHSGGVLCPRLAPSLVRLDRAGSAHLITAASAARDDQELSFRAPEQVREEVEDERTDVWRLGAVFYRMVTGELPFWGADRERLDSAIEHDDPARLTLQDGSLGPTIERILRLALAKMPDERYDHMGGLVADLETLRREIESGGRQETLDPRSHDSAAAANGGAFPKRLRSARARLGEQEPAGWWTMLWLPVVVLLVLLGLLLYWATGFSTSWDPPAAESGASNAGWTVQIPPRGEKT